MILLADSGSTKTTWCFISEKKTTEVFSTTGINPYFRTDTDIESELKSDLIPKISEPVKEIHFYGAGVVNEQLGSVVKNALSNLFPDADIETESDLLAAARATLQHKKGIACILGTGSNSCLYDGVEIVKHVPPLGYILGDEGSGTFLGRHLLADYLKQIMPGELATRFNKMHALDYSEFLDKVYRNENVRKFLAGFVPFLKENIENAYCKKLVEDSFNYFIERNISRYPGYQDLPVCFVGSIAYYFQEQLENVMKKYNLKTGIILKEPLENLIGYHLKNSQT